MRAMAIRENGAPDVLRLEDLPQPQLRPHDILVQVHATSVNPVDTKVRRASGPTRRFPLILGYDASGVVVQCGPRAARWQPGDEVYAAPDLFRDGADAELVALDSRAAARKPVTIDHATAAALPLVSLTAWASLHLRARIEPQQTVLIHAGAGGVGHIAVQLARLHGCRVITTAGRDESVAFCRDVLGADEVIDYRHTDFVARIAELTDGRGVACVLDTVGGENFHKSIECVAINGQLVSILGANTGNLGQTLLYRNITVHYEFMAIPTTHEIDPERPGRILEGIARLVDRGLLRPHVSRSLPLEQLPEAHRQLETGRTIGKVVINVRD